jgi:hypothetical protein
VTNIYFRKKLSALTKKIINTVLSAILVVVLFNSCNDDGFLTSEDVNLAFSVDTLMFDTIFTSIGSTTKSFRVINPHNRPVLISAIELAGGNNSPYRLNIDGEMSNTAKDIEVPARDSIYIFVELTVDPNGSNQPMIVQDSVVFILNSNIQDIDLLAWGQDFIPIKNQLIETTTWTAEKPYLIYNAAVVDTGHVLTIEPGTRIYFHKEAILASFGSIEARGTFENPIIFSSDRLEQMYSDIPDQWYGILLFPNEQLNIFENTQIKNARIGLQAGTLEYEGAAHVKLHNVRIEHHSYFGLLAIKSIIDATNVLVADCGVHAVALTLGGNYNFNHCTVANYWSSFSNRNQASVIISNRLYDESQDPPIEYVSDLTQAKWSNSIIWGNIESEIDLGHNSDYLFNFEFDNCLVKVSDSLLNAHPGEFEKTIVNIDPVFVDYREYNYGPDSISPAINAGYKEYGDLVPFDLNNVSRIADTAPDLGAFEYVKVEEDEEENNDN